MSKNNPYICCMKKIIALLLIVTACKKKEVTPTPEPEPTPVPVIDYRRLAIDNPIYQLEVSLSNTKGGKDSVYTQMESDGTRYVRTTKFKFATVKMTHATGGKMVYSISVDNVTKISVNGTKGTRTDTLQLY